MDLLKKSIRGEETEEFVKVMKYMVYWLVQKLNSLFRLLQAVNLLFFIFDLQPSYFGRGRCVSESLLGVKLVKANPNLERSQDYSFINRLIIWTAISKSVTWLV